MTRADHRPPGPRPRINTRELDLVPIVAELREVWPDFRWGGATLEHGAFHGVAVLDEAVVRVSVGNAHAARAAAEVRNARAVAQLGLPFRVPTPLVEPRGSAQWTAVAYTRVTGTMPESDAWADARRLYLPLLEAFATVPAEVARTALRPVRDWCGGAEWPALVAAVTERLDERLRERARALVADELALEAGSPVGMVHGDLHAFNLRVTTGRPTGLIDLDNATVSDPAHDLVWLLRSYPVAELAADVPAAALERARHYGATGPLKVAAAARSIGDEKLEAHALANFARRAGGG